MDICAECGAKGRFGLWVEEACHPKNSYHTGKCDRCDNLIGYVTDDDYCGPEKILCSDCVKKAMQLRGK